MTERLPRPVAARIAACEPRADETIELEAGARLVRVHPLAGPHPCRWDEFRRWGPTNSRFDHHPPPVRMHPRRSVAYVSRGDHAFTAALAEYFQDDGGGVKPFDLSRHRPAITVFELRDAVMVLDLDSGWITRAGGNQAIRTGPRARCRDWARVIYRAHPRVAGLAYGSSVWGPGQCVVLWDRAARAMPSTPLVRRTLDDPALAMPMASAAEKLGALIL